VLVIDDTEDLRFLYRAVLTRSGYEVVEAATGHEALAMVRTDELPDVIVLDVQMPDMDGWDTLAAIRSDARCSGIPVILCTVKSSENSVQRAWDAGCDGFLAKPFLIEELIEELTKVLTRVKLRGGPWHDESGDVESKGRGSSEP